MDKLCESCGENYQAKRAASRFCSRRCLWDSNAKRAPHNKGRGAGWTDRRGYRWIYVQDGGKPVAKREHRHVMELHLGRKLLPEELVHHINENKTDNRIENLMIDSWGHHASDHHSGAVRPDQFKKTAQVMANYREEQKRLMATKSDLLEALSIIVEGFWLSCDDLPDEFDARPEVIRARAAIAKARGEV